MPQYDVSGDTVRGTPHYDVVIPSLWITSQEALVAGIASRY